MSDRERVTLDASTVYGNATDHLVQVTYRLVEDESALITFHAPPWSRVVPLAWPIILGPEEAFDCWVEVETLTPATTTPPSRVAELRAYLDRELAIERDADGPIIMARHDALRIKLTIDFLVDALERMADDEDCWPGAVEAERILRILHSTERTT